jgi:predicted peptidase
MNRMQQVVTATFVAATVATAGGTAKAQVALEQRVFSSVTHAGERLPYVLMKPADWNASKKYPLLVFLHGAGERGDDNQNQLKWGREWMEQAVTQYQAVVVAPQCPGDCRWVEVDWGLPAHDMPAEMSRPMRLMFEMLPSIEKEYAIDPARRYIGGLSMGGYGAWDALCRQPDYFAAAVPICGGADEKQAKAIAKIPVWVFHGEVDGTVPVIRARNMVEAVKKEGGNPKYSEYPGVDHFSWVNAFTEPELLKWLFQQKRAASPAAKK